MKALKLLPLVVILAVGFAIAWEFYRPKPGKPETPAVAVREKDGSLELERAPSGLSSTAPAGSTPMLKPSQAIPKGAKVERIVEVTVDPTATLPPSLGPGTVNLNDLKIPSLGGPAALQAPICPPVRVDLSLIRLKDKSQRVLASSPDGTVVGGLDVPVNEAKLPAITRWTASGMAGFDSHLGKDVFGGQLQYQKGPIVFSGGVIGGTGFLGAGVKF